MRKAVELAENLGGLVGHAIVQKTLAEVSSYAEIEDLKERFDKIDGVITLSNSLSEGFKIVRAAGLAMVESLWENLPLEIRSVYDYQFRLYAEKRCPELSWKTIENHMRAARTFLLDSIQPAEPIIIDGESKPFDPVNIPISKLVLVRSAAESGQINQNPELWRVLVNGTVEDLRHELFSERSQKAKIDPVIKYELIGPYLIAKQNGSELILAQFDWEEYYKGTPLAREAIDRILKFLDVVPDEEIIRSMNRKFNAHHHDH